MIFNFSVQRTFNESIDIVDVGNTALCCTNKTFDNYYIIIKTTFGKTSILKFGPVCSEVDSLLNDFSVSYKKIDYKENAIYKEVDKFINDYKKEITSVTEITEYEAWKDFPAIQSLFENT